MRDPEGRRASSGDPMAAVRVSVIITFLDAGAFLEESIASVYAQSFSAWELLLVDDGSGDESPLIARRHAAARPDRVRVLEHPDHGNRGVSASRNLGIAHAGGALIAFLDADDVWLPEKLERQIGSLDAEPRAAMVYGATEYWRSWTTTDAVDRRIGPRPGRSRLFEPPELLVRFLEYREPIPSPTSVLVRRDAAGAVGGFEEPFTGLYEDQVFFAKMCLAHPVLVTGDCLDRYRQHPDSLTSVSRAADIDRARAVYRDWLERWLRESGCTDATVWRAFRRNESRRGRLWRAWRGLQRRLER
jgi:glycosyltransferase involved in cell wall biosynthesis